MSGILLACWPLVAQNGVKFTTSMTPAYVGEDIALYHLKYHVKNVVPGAYSWSNMVMNSCSWIQSWINLHQCPLVSKYAPFHLQWSPIVSSYIYDGAFLIEIKVLLGQYFVGPLSYYSTRVMVPLLRLKCDVLSPLDLLWRFREETKSLFVELELWLSQNTHNAMVSNSVVINMTAFNQKYCSLFIRQPWRRT
jgi:hypothetical protein